LKISNRIFFFDRTDQIDLIAKSHQAGEKNWYQKTELGTRNPDAEIQMPDDGKLAGAIKRNQKIFIKNYFYKMKKKKYPSER
jgi:hypothetical protein